MPSRHPRKREFSPRYTVPLVEQITEFLTQAIMDNQFASGERLVENELQRRFGVSRSPIRESYQYAIRVHRKILDYFVKKDAGHLEELVKEHILIALSRFIQFLDSQK